MLSRQFAYFDFHNGSEEACLDHFRHNSDCRGLRIKHGSQVSLDFLENITNVFKLNAVALHGVWTDADANTKQAFINFLEKQQGTLEAISVSPPDFQRGRTRMSTDPLCASYKLMELLSDATKFKKLTHLDMPSWESHFDPGMMVRILNAHPNLTDLKLKWAKPFSMELLVTIKGHPGLKSFEAGRCGYCRDINLENLDLWLYRFAVKDPTVNSALEYPHFSSHVECKDVLEGDGYLAKWARKQERKDNEVKDLRSKMEELQDCMNTIHHIAENTQTGFSEALVTIGNLAGAIMEHGGKAKRQRVR